METNYTLKKLIRGGTALLFLLAFMLTGTLSALGQDKAPITSFELKIQGPGRVIVSASPSDSYIYENPTEDVGTYDVLDNFGSLQINNVLTLQAIPIDDCFPFDTWTLDGPVFTAGFDGSLTSNTIEVRIADVNIVTATFTEDFLEPTLDDNGPVCENEMFEVTLSGTDIVFPADATFDIGTGSQTATVDADGGVLFQADDLAPGDYVFTLLELFDDNGCRLEAPISFTFTVNPLPEPSISVDSEYCADEEIEPTVSGANFGSSPDYLWTIGTLTSTLASPTFGPLSAGNYVVEVSVTNTETGCVGLATAPFTVNPLPTPTIAVDAEYCADEVIEPTVSGSNFGSTPDYTWYLYESTDLTSYIDDKYIADPTFGPLDAGEYTIVVIVQNEETFCVGVDTQTFTVNPLPVPSVAVTEVCEDDNASVTVTGSYFTEASSTFDWEIIDGATGTSSGSATFDLPSLVAGTYTIVVTVANEFGCIGVDSEVFTVNPLPYAEIDAPEEVCFDNNITKGFFFAQLVDIADLDEPYTITWTITGPEGTDNVVQNSPDNGITIDIADFALPYVTGQIITVVALLENEFGCEYTTESVDILVLERPWIINNDILAPQVGEVEKIVFCNIPKDLVELKGDGEPEINDLASCVDDPADASIIFQWQWRFLGETTWNPAAGDNNKADYELPRHTSSVQYRRLAKAVGCDCDSDDVEWWPSNVITLHIVPSIAALPTATDDVCFDEDASIDITGNIYTIEEYGPDGEPTGVIIPYVTGEWTLPAGIVFAEGFDAEDAEATILATGPGIYEIEWTLTAEDFVYTECLTDGYCCEYEVTGEVEVVFEDITLDITANFGLDAEYCADADEVVLTLPEIITVPPAAFAEVLFTEDFEGTVTGWTTTDLSGSGFVWTFGSPRGQNPPVFEGNYAIVDSDAAGFGPNVYASLTSPAIDLSGITDLNVLELTFGTRYLHLGGGFARVEVSSDGSSWEEVVTYTVSHVAQFQTFELEDFEGEDELYIRFVYNDAGSYAWYWIIDNITVTHFPEAELDYTLTMNGVDMVAVDGDYIFDPAEEGPGVYTFVFTATSPIGCVASYTGSVEVFEVPVVSLTGEVADFCEYDDTVIDLEDYVTSSIASGTWTFELGGVEISNLWVPETAGVGEYEITAIFTALEGSCVGENEFTLEVHPQPEIFEHAVVEDAPLMWVDPFTLWVHHDTPGVVTLQTVLDLVGGDTTTLTWTATGSEITVSGPNYWRSVFTIDPFLNVGVNAFTAFVTSNPAGSLECVSEVYEFDVTLVEPPHFAFNPFYEVPFTGEDEDGVDHDPVPMVDKYDVELFITFTEDIVDANGQFLTLSALGDLIKIREYSEHRPSDPDVVGTFTEVVKTVAREGNRKVNVLPVDDLKYNTLYRLSFVEISYLTEEGNFDSAVEFEWRLDGTNQAGDPAAVLVPGAFFVEREIWFQTAPQVFPVYTAYTLHPDPLCKVEDDEGEPTDEFCVFSICEDEDGIWVEFTNPVKYREFAAISNTDISKVTQKFKLEKSYNGTVWTTPAYEAIPKNFETVVGGDYDGWSGPTRIHIYLLDEDDNRIDMEYNTYYRIKMQPGFFGQGFQDMVTGAILMGDDEEIVIPEGYDQSGYAFEWADLEDAVVEDYWSWKTTAEYDILFAIHEPYQSYDAGNFNRIYVEGDQIVDLDANDKTVVVTPTFTANVAETFTVNATAGEGYYFVRWHRSTNGGATWTPLSTSAPLTNPVLGVNYLPRTATLDGRVIKQDDCGEHIAYKAQFAKFVYAFSTNELCDGISITPATINIPYGETRTFTAQIDENFIFDGWVIDPALTVTITFETEAETDVYNKWQPEVTEATLTFAMIDTNKNSFGATLPNHGISFEIGANCSLFEPEVFAAAQGVKVDEDGNIVEVVENNITQITFDSFYLPNIITIALEAENVFTGGTPPDANYYVMYKFVYGNPDVVPPHPFTNIQITAIDKRDDFCEYDWDNVIWERWNPALNLGAGDWEVYNEGDMSLAFIPDQNYRLRANFVWRDDVKVSATALSEASVIVFDDEGEVWINYNDDELLNNIDGDFFSPGDVLNLTSFPNEDYWTWRWYENVEGGEIADVQLVQRYLDRSEWTYEVGCDDVDLKAFVDLKEHFVVVRSSDADRGTVELSTPAIDENLGNQGGIGFVFEDFADFFPAALIAEKNLAGQDENQVGGGWFQRKSNMLIEFYANELDEPVFDNDDAPYWEFWKWVDVDGETISYLNPYPFNTDNLYTDMEVIAVYTYTYDADKYTVQVDVDPAGSGTVYGAGDYFADANTGVFEQVMLMPYAAPGWTFDEWVLIDGPEDFDIDGMEETIPLWFTMPAGDVHIEAIFVETEYPLCASVRTYLRVGDPDDFDFEVVSYGGTINFGGFENCDELVAGDEITLTATAIDGFQFVNWIEGDIVSGDGKILRGHQVGADNTLTYTVPAVDGPNSINLYAIFVEIADPQYPIYTLNTIANPAGFGNTYPAEEQLHARGVEIYVDQEVTEPGYKFNGWSSNVMYANGMAYVKMDKNQLATANYIRENYMLVVHTNDPALGTVQGGGHYVIDSTPLPVSATVLTDELGCEEYSFAGWFRDALLTVPLKDAGGNHITSQSFGFIPEVPAVGTTVNIWAKFEAEDVYFDIDLYTSHQSAGTQSVEGVEESVAPWVCGDKVKVTTTVNAGYEFQHWLDGDGEIYIEDMTFFHIFDGIVGSVSFTAVYEKIPFTVTTATDPAALGGETGADTYVIGDALTLTAIEHVGYTFDGWFENDVLLTSGLVYEEDPLPYGDRHFVAKYTIMTYDVTVVADPVAGGTVAGDGNYEHGTEITISASPAAGYDFVNWTSNGVEVTTEPSFFYNVIADADFVANFISVDCAKPTGLTAYVTATTAYVTWDDAVVTGWEVSYDGGTTWVAAPVNARYYDEIVPGTEFEYSVRAICNISGNVYSQAAEIEFATLDLGDVNADNDITPEDRGDIIAYMNNMVPEDMVYMTADELEGETGPFFIFDAADVNGDGLINILDLVIWVNIFKDLQDDKSLQSDAAGIHMDKDVVRLENDGTLAAIQFELIGSNLDMVELSMIASGYELFWIVDGDILTGFIVSLDNQAFAKGTTELFEIQHTDALTWGKVFAANLNGDKVDVDAYDVPTDITDPFASDLSVNVFPNPSSGQFTSVVDVPANSKVTLKLYDLSGREFASKQLNISGVEHVSWNEDLKPGMYILRMIASPEGRTDQSVTREVRVLIN